jgi:mono/diheme cytochrome c family protein
MPEPSDLPWDKRPVTPLDLAITAGLIVFAFAIVAGVVYLALRGAPPAAEARPPSQQAQAPIDQQVAVDEGEVDRGREVFQQSCASCHTIGDGPTVGPDLKGVTEIREQDWLLEWIQTPDAMLARGDPLATALLEEYNNIAMPNVGITEADAFAVIQFMRFESGDTAEPPPEDGPPPVVVEGDPVRGEALFTGLSQLSNEGPACMGCHSISGVGELGGGTLGPDLTEVSARYGPAGLTAALEGLPFPSMQGVFAEKPLTAEEVADLNAFFLKTESSGPAAPNLVFVGIGFGALVFLVALSQLIWRRRLKGVRIPLVGR